MTINLFNENEKTRETNDCNFPGMIVHTVISYIFVNHYVSLHLTCNTFNPFCFICVYSGVHFSCSHKLQFRFMIAQGYTILSKK